MEDRAEVLDVTTVKKLVISPETVTMREKREKEDKEDTNKETTPVSNVTTAESTVTSLEIAPTQESLTTLATTAKKPVTSLETVPSLDMKKKTDN